MADGIWAAAGDYCSACGAGSAGERRLEAMLREDPVGLARELLGAIAPQLSECRSLVARDGRARRVAVLKRRNITVCMLAAVRRELAVLREVALGRVDGFVGARASQGPPWAPTQAALAELIADVDEVMPGDYEPGAMLLCGDCIRLCHRDRAAVERACECGREWRGSGGPDDPPPPPEPGDEPD
jgi:hypothetical protein